MADMILLGLAIICTAYFMVIVFYAGMGTSFAFIWLFFAALCVFLVYGKWYYRKNMDRIPQWVPVSIVLPVLPVWSLWQPFVSWCLWERQPVKKGTLTM